MSTSSAMASINFQTHFRWVLGWVDGTSLGSANGGASRALLWVYLQKMETPHKMLGASVVGEVIALDDEIP